MVRLTKNQKKLIEDIKELQQILNLDYQVIIDGDKEGISPNLELARDHIIRGAIIMDYTFIDELLNERLSKYYFGQTSFIKLWRTKKFKNFNYYVLERLSLRYKLEHVQSISKIPSNISKIITDINVIRNALAHSFFPENRRKKPLYKQKDIYSMEGFKFFIKDVQKVFDYFMP